jgi:MFS superfamily sulfate permease-like transporter
LALQLLIICQRGILFYLEINILLRLPAPHLPAFELVPHLISDALSICVVVAAIHVSLAKMFGKRMHYTTDPGQEFYALGFTSMLASFFPIFPISTSLGRTVVNVEAGTKTQVKLIHF